MRSSACTTSAGVRSAALAALAQSAISSSDHSRRRIVRLRQQLCATLVTASCK
jgi:hypothetical protein